MPAILSLFEDTVGELGLTWLAGRQGADRHWLSAGTAAADLVGYFNPVHPQRIQVFGPREIAYYAALGEPEKDMYLTALLAGGPPALIFSDGLPPPDDITQRCEAAAVPVLGALAAAAHVIDYLRVYFARGLAKSTTMHGVLMDVLGIGVLITGDSGVGKSELALELISRGHGLVADDAVELRRIAPTVIEGRCPPLLQSMLEVRGLGLLDIQSLFGQVAVRRKMRLRLIVHLARKQSMEGEYERLPPVLNETVLDLPIRKVVLPVAAGRNLAVLLEAAVRNTILQLRGIDAMQAFIERQAQALEQASSDQAAQQ